ncbi:MAG: TonB-dependent receptor [Aestuariibacter sp.]
MNQRKFTKSKIALALGTIVNLSVGYVEAQEQDSKAEKGVIERIAVTATQREMMQEELPFNISAVQGSEIVAQNIVDSTELLRTVAGISLIDRGHRNSGTANSMVIRGINVEGSISGADVGQSTVPTVSTYVDSIPIYANFLLKDIQRVEVLRGPQGTLYGSGALGGTVRYIMNKPSTEMREGSIAIDWSQTDGSDGDNVAFDAVYNQPLSDTVAFRVSFGQMDNDGVIDQVNLYQLDSDGIPLVAADDGSCQSVNSGSLSADELAFNGACYESEKDVDSVEIFYARAGLSWDVTEDINVLLTHSYQDDEVGGRRAVTNGADYNGNVYGEYENGSTLREPSKRDVNLTSLEVSADLGFATLTSSTSRYNHEGSGWRDNTSLWVTDRSNGVGFTNWFNILYTGNPRPAAHVESGFKDEAFIQEFRLVSNSDNSQFDWVIGAFFMDQERTTTNFSHLRGLEQYGFACNEVGDACPSNGAWWAGVTPVNDLDFSYIRKEDFEDKALYGEVTYHVSDDFRVTGGLRWFDNTLSNETSTFFAYLQPADIPFVAFPTQDEDDIQTKLNLSYDINDGTMLYATFAEGFRRGGSNAIPDSGPFTELNPESASLYGKDTVKNYELGIKGYTRSFSYSADIYKVVWDDPQLNTATAWWGFFMAQNGEQAETTGLELEANMAVTDNLNIRVGYSYTDAELTKDLIQPQTGGVSALAGTRLPGVSEHVASINFVHNSSLTADIDMVSRLTGYYQSDSVNTVLADSPVQDEFGSFALWNASVQFLKGEWSAMLYIKNITNEEGITGSYPATYWGTDTGVFENYYGNNQKDYITRPRTIGVNVSYQF